MAYEVIMPKAGMSMETGKFIRWLKKIGEPVEQGEPLFEIETDKVDMEVEANNSGYLIQTMVTEGDDVPVTRTIGYIGEKDEKVDAVPAAASAVKAEEATEQVPAENKQASQILVSESGKVAATPLAKTRAAELSVAIADARPTGSHGEVLARDVEAITTAAIDKGPSATPLARKMAAANDISLDAVSGSGKGGKIRKDDVQNAMQIQTPVPGGIKPLSGMRKVIAQRMSKCHTEVPPVTLNTFADVTDLSALRKQLNERLKAHITYNDLIVWIAARALKEMPEVNVAMHDEGISENSSINIGIAVALSNGLIVPVLRNADLLSLREVSAQARDLALKARQGGLVPADYSGGSFTISNLGMYGIVSFNPIINQPESMILGVCAITQQLVMDDAGKIMPRQKMGLSLTFDHRALDGAQAAAFLKRIVTLMENPMEMLA